MSREISYPGKPDPAGQDPTRFIPELFNDIAPAYDLLNHLLSLGLDRHWRRRAALLSGAGPGARVLDACTGTGDLAAELGRLVGPNGQVLALDLAPNMLELGRRKYPPPHWPQLSFIQANAMSLPTPDNSLRAATIAFGLRNLPDLPAFFTEILRALAPQGQLVCLELTRPTNPLLRFFHSIFLHGVVPVLGRLLSGNSDAYPYLARSISAFLPPQAILQLMLQAGFEATSRIPLSGGIVTILLGTKPGQAPAG